MFELLTVQNTKTLKSIKYGYYTGILHLAPATLSGVNVCPKASEGCKKACLNTAGHGRFDNVQNARIRRTLLMYNNREEFKKTLDADITKLIRVSENKGLKPVVRINGTSDLPKLAANVARTFTNLQCMDYTKIPRPWERTLPNYHLTFSRSENNEVDCLEAIDHGINVAVVFKTLPTTYWGRPIINGDETDLRFLDGVGSDGKGLVVGLTAKGRAKKDETGFVV